MCQQGLLNVYALAEPLVEQNEREFRSTIQVGAGPCRPGYDCNCKYLIANWNASHFWQRGGRP